MRKLFIPVCSYNKETHNMHIFNTACYLSWEQMRSTPIMQKTNEGTTILLATSITRNVLTDSCIMSTYVYYKNVLIRHSYIIRNGKILFTRYLRTSILRKVPFLNVTARNTCKQQ